MQQAGTPRTSVVVEDGECRRLFVRCAVRLLPNHLVLLILRYAFLVRRLFVDVGLDTRPECPLELDLVRRGNLIVRLGEQERSQDGEDTHCDDAALEVHVQDEDEHV